MPPAPRFLLCLLVVLPLWPGVVGCTSTSDRILEFQSRYDHRALASAEAAAERSLRRDHRRHAIYWNLELGKTRFERGDHAGALQAWGAAEEGMDRWAVRPPFRLRETVATTSWNDLLLPYRGRVTERLLMHTYQSLAALFLGDTERAQVFRRRAWRTQLEAEQVFGDDLAADRAAFERRLGSAVPDAAVERSARSVTSRWDDRVRGPYATLLNPFTTHQAALMALAEGSTAEAEGLLARAAAMVPGNRFVQADRGQRGWLDAGEPLVYVYAELGLVPRRRPENLTVLQGFTGVSSLPLPVLVPAEGRARGVVADADRGASGTTRGASGPVRGVELADLGAATAAAFEREFPGVLLRAVTGLAAKEAATAAAMNQARSPEEALAVLVGGSLWKLAAAEPDLRGWSSLGDAVDLLRVPRPADGRLRLEVVGGRGAGVDLILPEAQAILVYLRSVDGERVRADVAVLAR
ncbi:hypothetical protein [Phycisphaera mikurensis]|uniref:hypothetical protein n=1 Tax=Phycisphaera mikurensis TaxID=547188 RepID=UPI0012B663CA|nr:hypothetical protein [Phycisphaera mikurensis]MBB6440878.1 hypothetical protein [Phycisphaera mikurensis]